MLDPGNQEKHVEYLHYCETLTALALLSAGGSFVIKFFTTFEDTSICLLYLLNIVFGKVTIFKPASSKSGNSETYIVCLNYKGFEFLKPIWDSLITPYKEGHFNENKSMFHLNHVSSSFLQEIEISSAYFMSKQIEKINDNIKYFKNSTQKDLGRVHNVKITVAEHYINKFHIGTIFNYENRRLVQNFDMPFFLTRNVKKYEFNQTVIEIKSEFLIPEEVKNKFEIEIKLGKSIPEILSSRFCCSKILNRFRTFNKCSSTLYLYILNRLQETTVIQMSDDYKLNYSEFQKYIFYQIFNSNKTNILLVSVPLLTNFLAGLFFILVSCYEKVYLHKNGFILLHDTSTQSLQKVKLHLKQLDMMYKSIPNYDCFTSDVNQIIPPNLIFNSNFFDLIWNYNELVLSSKQ